MTPNGPANEDQLEVSIETDSVTLEGNLRIPHGAQSIIVFAHGSGSSRHSSRNQYVASELNKDGMATLLFDLLTPDEEQTDLQTRRLRFDISLLARRVVGTLDWLQRQEKTQGMAIGLFGASTGAAAALIAAAEREQLVRAVVSRGGRPDLAEPALPKVKSPTLLIVGGNDQPVIGMNESALSQMTLEEKELEIVPGATHLFEEPGKLEEVAKRAGAWFRKYLKS